MANFPNWKDLKKSAQEMRETKFTPERQEELRDKAQKGIEVGREQLTKRLKGPAAHLRNIGSQFKTGLDKDADDATESTAAAPTPPPPAPTPPPATAPPAPPAPETRV